MAKQITQLKGMNAVMANLNREILAIKGRSMKGLIEAVIIMRRDMESTSPLIPVDIGNLRASWFVVTSMGGLTDGAAPNFKGDRAGELRENHGRVIGEVKALVSAVKEPVLIMGFSANYAVFVHEMVGGEGGKIDWSRPGSGAKFFEEALDRNKGLMLQIIRDNAYIR